MPQRGSDSSECIVLQSWRACCVCVFGGGGGGGGVELLGGGGGRGRTVGVCARVLSRWRYRTLPAYKYARDICLLFVRSFTRERRRLVAVCVCVVCVFDPPSHLISSQSQIRGVQDACARSQTSRAVLNVMLRGGPATNGYRYRHRHVRMSQAAFTRFFFSFFYTRSGNVFSKSQFWAQTLQHQHLRGDEGVCAGGNRHSTVVGKTTAVSTLQHRCSFIWSWLCKSPLVVHTNMFCSLKECWRRRARPRRNAMQHTRHTRHTMSPKTPAASTHVARFSFRHRVFQAWFGLTCVRVCVTGSLSVFLV